MHIVLKTKRKSCTFVTVNSYFPLYNALIGLFGDILPGAVFVVCLAITCRSVFPLVLVHFFLEKACTRSGIELSRPETVGKR